MPRKNKSNNGPQTLDQRFSKAMSKAKENKKKPSMRKSKRNMATRIKRASRPSFGVHLAPKTRDYFRMLCDPTQFADAGVPEGVPTPSLKTHAFAKGTFYTGNQNVGFVIAAPWLGAVNDAACGLYTGAGFTGNAFTTTAAPPNVNNFSTNAPFTSADIGPAPLGQYRLISAVLRIRYSGTVFTQGGTIHALQHPEHESLNNMTAPGVDAYRQAGRYPVTRKWTSVLYCPSIAGQAYFENFTAAAAVTAFMGLIVDSPHNNQFDWEFHASYEYVGRNIRGQTPANIDPVAFRAATEVMALPPFGTHENSASSFAKAMEALLVAVLARGTTYVVGSAGKALSSAVSALPLGV